MRRLSLVAASRGYSLVSVHGLLTAVASLVAEQGSRVPGLQWLWRMGSVVEVSGLSRVDSVVVAHWLSCSEACGIFPDQGSIRVRYTGRQICIHCTTKEVLIPGS